MTSVRHQQSTWSSHGNGKREAQFWHFKVSSSAHIADSLFGLLLTSRWNLARTSHSEQQQRRKMCSTSTHTHALCAARPRLLTLCLLNFSCKLADLSSAATTTTTRWIDCLLHVAAGSSSFVCEKLRGKAAKKINLREVWIDLTAHNHNRM